MRNRLFALLTALLTLAAGAPAQAAEMIVNGGFETTSFYYMDGATRVYRGTAFGNHFTWENNPDHADGTPAQDVEGWTSDGYNFIFNETGSSSASGTTAVPNELQFWGNYVGPANGYTASPDGGNYVASDGAFLNGPLTQVINGLEAGKQYTLAFWWSAAQQYADDGNNFNGETHDAWTVCFGTCSYTKNYDIYGDGYSLFNNDAGDQIISTETRTVPEHGFIPWKYETMTFTASADGSATLSLLAYGTPIGKPPFALIDGVSFNPVPEPTTWAMMLIGFGLIGGAMRTRSRASMGRGVRSQIV